jgi:hypothetical protein
MPSRSSTSIHFGWLRRGTLTTRKVWPARGWDGSITVTRSGHPFFISLGSGASRNAFEAFSHVGRVETEVNFRRGGVQHRDPSGVGDAKAAKSPRSVAASAPGRLTT